MHSSSHIKPISYLKAKAVIQDVRSHERTQETLALLKILALGSQELEAGNVSPLEDIASRLRDR